jgi:pantoate--beta-alanine ligase
MDEPIAFVPTMGALHKGHLALIKRARELSSNVVVSVFVNPLQFENSDDLANYPRDTITDTKKAFEAGATRVWTPTYEEIYPGVIERQSAGVIGTLFEGKERPGHFDGVLTVIKRLFELVRPEYALFGEKDFQQLFIIKRWVQENHVPVQIIAMPTVRNPQGVALSSRNIRLAPSDLVAAEVINRALRSGNQEGMLRILSTEPKFKLDYAEIIDEETFGEVTSKTDHARGLIAGWINQIRLIDNMSIGISKVVN